MWLDIDDTGMQEDENTKQPLHNVKLSEYSWRRLWKLKEAPNETYDSVIIRLLKEHDEKESKND